MKLCRIVCNLVSTGLITVYVGIHAYVGIHMSLYEWNSSHWSCSIFHGPDWSPSLTGITDHGQHWLPWLATKSIGDLVLHNHCLDSKMINKHKQEYASVPKVNNAQTNTPSALVVRATINWVGVAFGFPSAIPKNAKLPLTKMGSCNLLAWQEICVGLAVFKFKELLLI